MSDTHCLDAPAFQEVVPDQSRADDCGEEVADQTDAQGYGETADRTRAELEQDDARQQGRDVGVEDGGERAIIAGLDGRTR
jgi:hypothetical protein